MQKKPTKLFTHDPKKFLPGNPLDHSYLGYHVSSVDIDQLTGLNPGVVFLGLADDTGIANVGGRLGARSAPVAIRNKLFKFTTQAFSFPIYDIGDLEPQGSISETHAIAQSILEKIHISGHTPLVMGGGHDLAYPESMALLCSFPKHQATIVNIDAHLDVRPVREKITSGSPFYLVAESEAFQKKRVKIFEFGIQTHCNAHLLFEYAKKKNFQVLSLEKIRKLKPTAPKIFSALIEKTPAKNKVQVSLDIDSVQWAYAPGCSAPQVSGFHPEEVLKMSFIAGTHHRVTSFGIFELSPPLDPDGRTTALVAHCMNQFLLGYHSRTSVRKKSK